MRTSLLALCLLLVPSACWAQGLPALEEAQRAFNRGDLDEAIRKSTSAIAAPDLPPKERGAAFTVRGIAYGKKGDHARAIREFSTAIDLNPLDPEAFYNRGVAYTALRDFDQAMRDFGTVIRLDPKNSPAFYSRGFVYLLKGRLERAIQDFDDALQINPTNASALHSRGRAYSLSGEPDRAIRDFDAALRIDPSDVESLYQRGFVRLARGDLDRAAQDLDTAARLSPNQLPPLPPSMTSEYLVTKGSGIVLSNASGALVWSYSLFLQPTSKLSRRAHLVVAFQNPADRNQPIVVTTEIAPGGSPVLVASPPVSGLVCGLYHAVVHVYEDQTRRTRLGIHIQMIRSTLNMSKVTTLAEAALPERC